MNNVDSGNAERAVGRLNPSHITRTRRFVPARARCSRITLTSQRLKAASRPIEYNASSDHIGVMTISRPNKKYLVRSAFLPTRS